MELRHLRYFVAVAETENVSKAALKLHVSQPAVSRQIRDLENELGIPLFERNAKSVRLTQVGRAFLDEARAVLQRADEAFAAARRAAEPGRGEIHVGYAPSLTARLLPATLRAFAAAMPGMCVRLHDLSTEEMLESLHERKLELAFLAKIEPKRLRGLQFQELTRDPLCIAVAPAHPFARKKAIPVEQLAKEPWVAYARNQYPEYHDLLASVFAPIKGKPRVVEEHESVAGLIAAVEAGTGVALVTRSLGCTAGQRVKLLPLSSPPPPLTVGIAWTKNQLSKAGESFVDCAKKAASNIS